MWIAAANENTTNKNLYSILSFFVVLFNSNRGYFEIKGVMIVYCVNSSNISRNYLLLCLESSEYF